MKNGPPLSTSRRTLLLAGLTWPLAGCDMPYGLSLDSVKTCLAVGTGLEGAPGVTLQQASQIPYATIGYRVGKSSENVLILASTTSDGMLWTAADHHALVTVSGRVTRSAGFDWNLGDTSFLQPDPVQTGLHQLAANVVLSRAVDLRDIERYGLGVQSTFTPVDKKSINVLGTDINVVEVNENCECRVLNWTFQNTYWADVDSGFVWRSVQTVHPNLSPLTIEVLRPAT